jgi:sterol desaturase/sphingolipid hydroxylase (fatty acid hydroxylase superfamily)
LIIEDHDLHHRKGYRKSSNYGKQTMLWDRLFGTKTPRLESENVDFDLEVHMPLF